MEDRPDISGAGTEQACASCGQPRPWGEACPSCGAGAEGGTPASPDGLFPHYVVLERIGEGGMGEVFRGHPAGYPKQLRALKVIKPGLGGIDELERRFRNEVIALQAIIKVPGVVPVLDSGRTTDGRFFLVMDWVEGRSLAAALDDPNSPMGNPDHPDLPAQARALVQQLASALDASHAAGVLHRDIKPSNVMLAAEGAELRAVLIDFGIASLAREDDATASRALGTIEHLAPEVARGEPATVQTDVYLLAHLMYRVLTGRRQTTGQLKLPSRVSERYSAELDRVVLDALADEVGERPAGARALAGRLARALGAEPAPGASAGGSPRRSAVGHRTRLAAVLASVVVGGFALTRLVQPDKPDAAPPPVEDCLFFDDLEGVADACWGMLGEDVYWLEGLTPAEVRARFLERPLCEAGGKIFRHRFDTDLEHAEACFRGPVTDDPRESREGALYSALRVFVPSFSGRFGPALKTATCPSDSRYGIRNWLCDQDGRYLEPSSMFKSRLAAGPDPDLRTPTAGTSACPFFEAPEDVPPACWDALAEATGDPDGLLLDAAHDLLMLKPCAEVAGLGRSRFKYAIQQATACGAGDRYRRDQPSREGSLLQVARPYVDSFRRRQPARGEGRLDTPKLSWCHDLRANDSSVSWPCGEVGVPVSLEGLLRLDGLELPDPALAESAN